MVESIFTVVLEVAKCLAPPTQRQVSYLRSYNNNFENLKREIEKTKGDRASIQHAVDEAKRQGEDIEENVDKWLESVKNVIVEAEKLVGIHEDTANNRCFKWLCPNLKSRLQHGKEAVTHLEAISKLHEDGRFDRISYRPVLEDIRLLSSKDYEAFQSRTSTLNDVRSALKDPDVNMLGIYGMGGIGKTMLAKEVARQVKTEFDRIIFVKVSPSPNIREIQGEIADGLGLKFDEESESGRASCLCNRLKKYERILIILDDIWENLDLLTVGIPHGDDHKGCKVLLTARSEDVLLRKMDSQQIFLVGVLKKEEAWSLFKKMTGGYIEGSQFKSVATDVAMECAGLPVSIVTIAKALRNKRLFEWKDALEQLRRPSSMNFKNIQRTAFSAIELSYNHLENEELKKVFLLIGYTYLESIDKLLMYGMGLGLFQGINNMEEARARVRTLVQNLKASCMLLDNIREDERLFSMHDVVRDVAIAIASREENVLTVTNGELINRWEWSKKSVPKHCDLMVLHNVKMNDLPEVLECPQVKLISITSKLFLSLTIPDKFFTGMIQVIVLDLANINLPSLPSSLGLLANLRTLCLNHCVIRDASVIGELKKLEILHLQNSDIKRLPKEVGQLTQLRLLDLRGCWELKVIPPNVLSKLSHLEELYIYSFDKWEVEVEGLKNANLDELNHLPNLTSLELRIKDVNTLLKGLFFMKLEKYKIYIGHGKYWDPYGFTRCSRMFRLELNTNICLKNGLIVRLEKVEDLSLSELQDQDIKNFVYELANAEVLQLKNLTVRGCDVSPLREPKRQEESTINMQSSKIIFEDSSLFTKKVALPKLETLFLHSINIERIWQNQLAVMSCGIQNLKRLKVYECRNLRCLFSSSIVNSFDRLFSLKIEKCPILEEIIVVDQTKRKTIIFPQLRILTMKNLEKLASFCTGDVHIEFPSLEKLNILECPEFMRKHTDFNHDLKKKRQEESTTDMQSNEIVTEGGSLFNEKVALPKLETLFLHSINIERIWQNHLAIMPRSLRVYGCKNLRCLFSSPIIDSFDRLISLRIEKCPMLEEIIVVDQTERKNIKFPQLRFLEMIDLEKLTNFCTGDVHIEFPSMEVIDIRECPEFMVKYKSFNHDLKKEVSVFPNRTNFAISGKKLSISTFNFLQRIHVKILNILGLRSDRVPEAVSIRLEDETIGNEMKATIRIKDMKHILKHSAVLDNLEQLEIQSIKTLVNLVPSSPTFQNLTILVVSSCERLIKLFTSLAAKNLVRLRVMKIKNCFRIKEIVADDERDNSPKGEIVFRELNELELFGLKSLTSFCSGNYALKFPSLETLSLEDCNNLKIFSRGELSTPKLRKVLNKPSWIWAGDLNTTIQLIYNHANGIDASSRSMENPRTVGDVTDKSKPCQLAEIVDSGKCRLVTMSESTNSSNKVVRLLYTNSGVSLLALGSNGVHKLWRWLRSQQNLSGKAIASAVPQHWLPSSGLLMANDVSGVNLEEAVPCIALSKNDLFVISATGGKVSLFSMITFELMTTFMSPPPASTFLAFHPRDNNIIAIGMEDSTIHIYDVTVDELISELKGHQNRITGLAFSTRDNILVSSDADAQLCVWSLNTWQKKKSVAIQIPAGKTPTGDTQVQFNTWQFCMLVVHETQLVIYDATRLAMCDASEMERVRQWIPQDALSAPISCAVYSCNSQLVFATFCDGNIGVFDAYSLILRYNIAPSTYLSPSILNSGYNISRSQAVYPLVVAAHPSKPNQFAIGLTDGSVKVMEPSESEGKWGESPPAESEDTE